MSAARPPEGARTAARKGEGTSLNGTGVDAVVARVQKVYAGWGRETTAAQMRADWDALFAERGEAQVQDVEAGGVHCRWIAAPGARADRAVLYLHGGGFQIGSPDSHHELMARISAASGARVLAVDYRLAPEHPAPAAHDDAASAWAWLVGAGGLAPHQVALAGDSAGGGVALSLLLQLHSQHAPLPAAAWTLSAWTDLTLSGESHATRAERDPINRPPMLRHMARAYLGAGGDAGDPRFSPLLATSALFEGLPPLLLQVGEREIVFSDSDGFARRARAAGVAAELQMWPGMVHVFQQFPAELAQAQSAVAAGGQFLAAQFDAALQRRRAST